MKKTRHDELVRTTKTKKKEKYMKKNRIHGHGNLSCVCFARNSEQIYTVVLFGRTYLNKINSE